MLEKWGLWIMSELSANDFLEIKRKVCSTHRHCIKCEFYYACIAISNASDKEIKNALQKAEEIKESEPVELC